MLLLLLVARNLHTAVQGQGGSHRQAVSNTRTGLVAEKGKKLLTSNSESLAVRVPSTLPPKITTLGGISHHKAIWEVGDSRPWSLIL